MPFLLEGWRSSWRPLRLLGRTLFTVLLVGVGDEIGRAWKSSELRLKSYDDLHKLWYVLLKEKNLLLTEKYDCKSRNVVMPHPERLHKVKLSMKRLKGVLAERKVEYDKLKSAGEMVEERAAVKPKFEE